MSSTDFSAFSGTPSSMRVLTKPGAIAFTVTPLRGVLARQRLGQADQAGLRGGVVRLPEVADAADDARDVDDPAPAARRPSPSMKRWVMSKTLFRLVLMTASHAPRSIFRNEPSRVTPALLTRMSMASKSSCDPRAHRLHLAAHADVEGIGLRPASQRCGSRGRPPRRPRRRWGSSRRRRRRPRPPASGRRPGRCRASRR